MKLYYLLCMYVSLPPFYCLKSFYCHQSRARTSLYVADIHFTAVVCKFPGIATNVFLPMSFPKDLVVDLRALPLPDFIVTKPVRVKCSESFVFCCCCVCVSDEFFLITSQRSRCCQTERETVLKTGEAQ